MKETHRIYIVYLLCFTNSFNKGLKVHTTKSPTQYEEKDVTLVNITNFIYEAQGSCTNVVKLKEY